MGSCADRVLQIARFPQPETLGGLDIQGILGIPRWTKFLLHVPLCAVVRRYICRNI